MVSGVRDPTGVVKALLIQFRGIRDLVKSQGFENIPSFW